jgi:hypothetical protein
VVVVAPWKRNYIKILRRLPVEINEQTKTDLSCFRNTLSTLAGLVRMLQSAFSNLLVCRANNNNYLFILLSHMTECKFHTVNELLNSLLLAIRFYQFSALDLGLISRSTLTFSFNFFLSFNNHRSYIQTTFLSFN